MGVQWDALQSLPLFQSGGGEMLAQPSFMMFEREKFVAIIYLVCALGVRKTVSLCVCIRHHH